METNIYINLRSAYDIIYTYIYMHRIDEFQTDSMSRLQDRFHITKCNLCTSALKQCTLWKGACKKLKRTFLHLMRPLTLHSLRMIGQKKDACTRPSKVGEEAGGGDGLTGTHLSSLFTQGKPDGGKKGNARTQNLAQISLGNQSACTHDTKPFLGWTPPPKPPITLISPN